MRRSFFPVIAQPLSAIPRSPAARPSVLRTSPVSSATWWEMCEANRSATFFATPDWANILTSTFSRFHAKPFFLELGADAACLIPAVEVRRVHPQLSALHSMPFGTYGGVFCRGYVEAETRDAFLQSFIRERGPRLQRTFYPNPLADSINEAVATHVGYVHTLDLSGGWQTWWEGLHGRDRYEFKKAEQRGVDVRDGMDPRTFETFCENHARQALSRNADVTFPVRFYRSLWEQRSPRIQLWTAHENGRMVAGVLAFRFQSQLTPFLSFVLPEARADAPTHLIYARMFRRAAEEGATDCNFLGSGGIPSIERFKISMGARRREFHYVNVPGPLYGVVHHPIVPWIRRRSAGFFRR